jgi:polyisoprenoid-binding protein YceI
MQKVILGVLVTLGLLSSSAFAADNYKIDSTHSTLGFSVKHMMVSHTTGQFDKYDGQIMFNPNDLASSKIDVTIETSSINTRNEKRDEHLKNPDFFDVAKFPSITFVSKKITATDITGDLTIKGVTKEVTIPVTITGPIKGMMGNDVIGINGTFAINRQDYGLTWNKTLDQGGLAVGNDVVLNISVEAGKQEEAKEVVK